MLHSGSVKNITNDKKKMTSEELYNNYMKAEPNVLKLELTLNSDNFYGYLSEEEKLILNKYGKVEKAITRDILVPADITLHALNYVIQRAFGWQNSHLHHFKLPKEVFQELTGGKSKADEYGYIEYDGKYQNLVKLCGLYFRYPYCELEDLYWDEDYEETESIKSWFTRKYTGPYRYEGYSENYHYAHKESVELFNELDKDIKIQDALLSMEGRIDELLERLPVMQVLYPISVSADKDIIKKIDKIAENQKKEIINLPVIPVTDTLCYEYDYGDSWDVCIKLKDCYYLEQKAIAYNMDNVAQSEELSLKLAAVIDKKKPVCIAADGLPVMDDVGGIYGYIEFLKNLHEGSKEEREKMKVWACFMGWTGRMNRAEKLL